MAHDKLDILKFALFAQISFIYHDIYQHIYHLAQFFIRGQHENAINNIEMQCPSIN